LQNAISEKEGVKHELKDTVYFPADIPLMLAQHTDHNILYFLAHKMHCDFFVGNFRKKQ
jgi:hypothetical protein